jgi:hypothetical protein
MALDLVRAQHSGAGVGGRFGNGAHGDMSFVFRAGGVMGFLGRLVRLVRLVGRQWGSRSGVDSRCETRNAIGFARAFGFNRP